MKYIILMLLGIMMCVASAMFVGYQWGASTAKPIDQGNISGLRK